MAATANGPTEDEVQAPTGVIRPDRSTPVGDSDASPEPLAPQEEGATVAPEQNEPSVAAKLCGFFRSGLPVNLRHLKFENMRISKETQEGLSSLVIEGTIVSISGKPTEVPQLRFAARDASGQEVYTWSALPSRSILGPGEKLDFRLFHRRRTPRM